MRKGTIVAGFLFGVGAGLIFYMFSLFGYGRLVGAAADTASLMLMLAAVLLIASLVIYDIWG